MLLTKFVYQSANNAIISMLNQCQTQQQYIRELTIPESLSKSDQKNQFSNEEGTKKTLLRLADQGVPSSLGFMMPIKNFPDPFPQLMFNQQDSQNQQLSNNKKKERNKQHSLKYLSFKVRNLVGLHKETTYKQMADILVTEISNQGQSQENQNLKRRVYDSINVMVALGVLEKQKKIITKGWMFQQNYMTSKYVGETLERFKNQRNQKMAAVREKNILFKKLTQQLQRIEAQQILNKEQSTEDSPFLHQTNNLKNKKYYFPLMIFTLPQNQKLKITSDDNETEVQIQSDQEIKLIGDYDILPLIKRIEEVREEKRFNQIKKF